MQNTDFIGAAARSMLGKPYVLGAKWELREPYPTGPIDCSGFIRWVFFRGTGIVVPDGSEQQREACVPADGTLPLVTVGFFVKEGVSHHVGLLLDHDTVIEARGDPYHAVILRPRTKWEDWKEFSGWMIFKSVKDWLANKEAQ